MVRPPSFDSNGMKRGAWSEEEDYKLRTFVLRFGHANWRLLPSLAGLARCGKSCRLRWVNYLQPGLKKGNFTKEEEDIIIRLHKKLGNKWSAIADELPGRTDNDIKNHWHAHINKRSRPVPTRVISATENEQINRYNKPNQEENTGVFANTSAPSPPPEVNAQDDTWRIIYDNLQPLPENAFLDFGQCSNNNAPTSSEGGITYLPPFALDDIFFKFGLYPNDMPSFSDSSEGGTTSPSDSPTEESNGMFWSEYVYGDDTVDMVLWDPIIY